MKEKIERIERIEIIEERNEKNEETLKPKEKLKEDQVTYLSLNKIN